MGNKQKKDILKELNESKIRSAEMELQRHIKALVKHRFVDTLLSGIYFEDLYWEEFRCGCERLDKVRLSKKKRRELEIMLFWPEVKKEETVEQHNLRYKKTLIGWAKQWLNQGFTQEQKEDLVLKSLQHAQGWSDQFNRTSKVYNELKKVEEKRGKKR